MKITIDSNLLQLDIYDLVEHMDSDVALRLADAVSLHPAVIEDVTEQILGGWTKLDSRAARGIDCNLSTPLDRAVREVAKRAGETAKGEIERLEAALRRTEEHAGKMEEWCEKNLDRRQRDALLNALR